MSDREFELVTLPAAIRAVVQGCMLVKRLNHRSFAWYTSGLKHLTMKYIIAFYVHQPGPTISAVAGHRKDTCTILSDLNIEATASALPLAFALQNSLNATPPRARIVAFGVRRRLKIYCRNVPPRPLVRQLTLSTTLPVDAVGLFNFEPQRMAYLPDQTPATLCLPPAHIV